MRLRVSENQRHCLQPTSLDIEDEPANRHTALPVYQDMQYDDDDDEIMALGDEAMNSLLPAVSDDDEQLVRDNDVSPIMDHVSDVPELINQTPLRTPPATPLLMKSNPAYEDDEYRTNNNNNRENKSSTYYSTQYQSNYDDLYDSYHSPAISNLHTVRTASFDRRDRSMLCLFLNRTRGINAQAATERPCQRLAFKKR